ncbi:uncharacterized protein HKW66_Vig0214600 [Vigna angularis]|uniref:Uncharacterized protein n=3 Tax=Phaseolus angularis TaxID=3914 RepID=A0A8T0JDK4_PHAAN|nr:uncharacterized protein LOC108333343 [Vigna angularis]KAG2371286.1 uncharacterized protein HKW66_Vig0214600 [Vigna angularis]BAT91832.1 hypothetical protein VIGAN_07046700 [Vigna angularis var. angularis]
MPLHSLPDDNHHDFVAELTHRMACFLLSDDDTLHSSRDSIHESAEGCSQEPSPSAAPEERSWKSGYDMFGKLQSFNIGLYSHQSLVQEQIRAIELSGVKQDQVAVSPKQTPAPHRKNLGQTYEPKKGNVRRARPPRPGPQHGAGMRALFLDGPGSRGGTGVFLPRAGAPTPSESTNKQGKGCSTVLIPARVVQALQLHFDQMAATSGPKAGAFHPLHDVVVSDRDGMYSLQNHQSQKAATSIQNETILPQEWAY